MQRAQQLHTELVLYPVGAVPRESRLALGACPLPPAVVWIRIRCAFQRTSPPHPTFFSVVCIPVLSQHAKLNRKTTFGSTNCTGQMGTQCTGQAWPHLQQGAWTWSMKWWPACPEPPSDCFWLVSKPGFAWCYCGCFWAPASLDLHLTLYPRVSLVPMSPADIKLGWAVAFLKGTGTSG